MGIAPYQQRSQCARPTDEGPALRYTPNPAYHLTDQGSDPDPQDLAWCIRRCWRVIYYSARYAAGQPLWAGADEFEVLMADVLWRLSSAFQPIPPLADSKPAEPEKLLADFREDRIYQQSDRVFRTPRFDRRERPD